MTWKLRKFVVNNKFGENKLKIALTLLHHYYLTIKLGVHERKAYI